MTTEHARRLHRLSNVSILYRRVLAAVPRVEASGGLVCRARAFLSTCGARNCTKVRRACWGRGRPNSALVIHLLLYSITLLSQRHRFWEKASGVGGVGGPSDAQRKHARTNTHALAHSRPHPLTHSNTHTDWLCRSKTRTRS